MSYRFALAALFLCACQSPKAEKNSTNETPSKSVTEEAKSFACKIDDQCDTYYRCIAAKCVTPPAITGEGSESTPKAILQTKKGKVTFSLELAVSVKEMTRGLMYRKSMKKDWGMLFIYDDVRVRSFWMKNTLIPLDMLFIDEKGIVQGIVENAEPKTELARGVDKPAKYVLELLAGQAKALGIHAGDRMALTHVEAWQDIEK